MQRTKLTFAVATSANDDTVQKYALANPPSAATATRAATDIWTQVRRATYSGSDYDFYNALMKWDTSSIPDNARIISAELELYCEEVAQVNGFIGNGIYNYGAYDNGWSLYADWRVFDGTDADWVANAAKTAHAGVHMTFFAGGETVRLALLNPAANVSKTGTSGIRLVLGDSVTPTGDNHIGFASYDGEQANATHKAPRLTVEYELPEKRKGWGSSAGLYPPRDAWGIHRPWHTDSYSGAYLDNTITRCGGNVPKWFSVFFDWGSAYPPANDQDLLPLRTQLRARGMGMAHCEIPAYFAGGNAQTNYRLANIAAGTFDSYLAQRAQRFAAYGDPVIFRFAHEMNSDYNSWSIWANSNTAADYVAAWRRVYGIFQVNGATNCLFTWNVITFDNFDSRLSMRPQDYYPGDAYVDYVAVNGYNFGTLNTEGWVAPLARFKKTYDALRVLTSKPIIVTEFASAESGGSKPQWISDFYAALPTSFPEVVSTHIYDEAFMTGSEDALDSTTAALNAFQAQAAKPEHALPNLGALRHVGTQRWSDSLALSDSYVFSD